ncbi:hypothetical protein BGZ60DRAFT_430391 [Tricladium varicosporioides]|nr:hypothetical protein BGZ60DRAFT_430391 [Hymenoscyphus varicosporioides]
MLHTVRSRAVWQISRRAQISARRSYAFSSNENKEINVANASKEGPNVSKTDKLPIESVHSSEALPETVGDAGKQGVMQAPNRAAVWSRSQNPRAKGMSGPRFEQTTMEDQPRPMAAIDLIHQQPVRWTHSRIVECDGGGGPLGHPKIFINTDKPQICMCTYCGLPFANEHHRKHIEALADTAYPLEPQAKTTEVPGSP